MRLFEAVKNTVSAFDAAVWLGMKPNRSKLVCCPYHDDRHPSMKVDKRFYCFACGAKGDAIDLVSYCCNVDLKSAALMLSREFNVLYDDNSVVAYNVKASPNIKSDRVIWAERIRDLSARLSRLHSFLRERKNNIDSCLKGDSVVNPLFYSEEELNCFWSEMEPYMNDFSYVDYLYEYFILDAAEENKKRDFENIKEEVERLEREYFKRDENCGGSDTDAGDIGKRMAV